MYVHVEVLEGSGCLADIGSHETDRIIVRVGAPESTKGTAGMATDVLTAPDILHTPLGVAVPDKLSSEIKRQITKRAFNRDLNKYQLRLYAIRHDGEQPKWRGIVGFKLLFLTDGFVIERWVPMQKATKTEAGALRVRVVVRESEAAARAILESGAAAATHTTPREGCCCDVCDPDFRLANPLIEVFELDEKHVLSNKAGRALASAMVCTVS